MAKIKVKLTKSRSKHKYHLKMELKSGHKEKIIQELQYILECAKNDKVFYAFGDDGWGYECEIDFVKWKDS